jgi:hypothetical protein
MDDCSIAVPERLEISFAHTFACQKPFWSHMSRFGGGFDPGDQEMTW